MYIEICFHAVCTVLGLEKGKECIIVGTLFKHMKLKPRVLDEYSKEVFSFPYKYLFLSFSHFHYCASWRLRIVRVNEFFIIDIQKSAAPLVKPHNFVHQDDHLVLEDESGRVNLRGNVLLPSVYVTGLSHELLTIMILGKCIRMEW